MIESTLENHLVTEFDTNKDQVSLTFFWSALAATPTSLLTSYVSFMLYTHISLKGWINNIFESTWYM